MKLVNLTAFQWLLILGLPLILVLVGVFAKKLGKKDGDDSPPVNDWAVCTAVLLMTFGKVAADVVDVLIHANNQTQVAAAATPLFWLFGILLVIFISIEHDRFRSWIKDAAGRVDKKKRLYVGVILPDLVSIIVFASYQAGKV